MTSDLMQRKHDKAFGNAATMKLDAAFLVRQIVDLFDEIWIDCRTVQRGVISEDRQQGRLAFIQSVKTQRD